MLSIKKEISSMKPCMYLPCSFKDGRRARAHMTCSSTNLAASTSGESGWVACGSDGESPPSSRVCEPPPSSRVCAEDGAASLMVSSASAFCHGQAGAATAFGEAPGQSCNAGPKVEDELTAPTACVGTCPVLLRVSMPFSVDSFAVKTSTPSYQ